MLERETDQNMVSKPEDEVEERFQVEKQRGSLGGLAGDGGPALSTSSGVSYLEETFISGWGGREMLNGLWSVPSQIRQTKEISC